MVIGTRYIMIILYFVKQIRIIAKIVKMVCTK